MTIDGHRQKVAVIDSHDSIDKVMFFFFFFGERRCKKGKRTITDGK